MRIATLAACLVTVATLAGTLEAQERGSQDRVWTVQEVRDEARDDAIVTVRGKVVRHVGDDEFMLADDTGEIRIDADDDVRRPDVGASVEVRGEADRDSSKVAEIEADRISLL